MGRAHFPVTVRQTLNSAAFDMKKKTLPQKFNSVFEKRPTVSAIVPASKAFLAKGFDVKSMKSTVAIVDNLKSKSAAKDIALQETGKPINQKFVALPQARTGGSWRRNVQSKYRFDKVKSNLMLRGRASKKRFKQSAYYAKKQNKYLYYKDYIVEVISITKGDVKLKFLYKKIDKKYTPKHKGFMKKSSEIEGANMGKNFVSHASKKLKLRN